jgi:hypothetical protein
MMLISNKEREILIKRAHIEEEIIDREEMDDRFVLLRRVFAFQGEQWTVRGAFTPQP